MKKTLFFIVTLILLTGLATAQEVLKDIPVGRNFIVDKEFAIYSDYSIHSLGKYSEKGKKLLDIGRDGEGPGDIKRLGWFGIHPKDSLLYVTEFVNGNKWISRFSPDDGKFVGEWPFEFDWNTWKGIPKIQFDRHGSVYIQAIRTRWRKYKDFKVGSVENIILKYSPTGKREREIYRFEMDFMAEKWGKGNITIPFQDYLYWRVNDDTIAVRENRSTYIAIFDLDGSAQKKIALPFKAEKVTKKDLDGWQEWLLSLPDIKKGVKEGWYDVKFWRRNLPISEYKPVSGGQMFFDSKGYLYSRKYPGYKEEKENLWAKIDVHSGKIALLHFPLGYWLRCIQGSYFYFAAPRGDEDVVVIKVHEKELSNIKSIKE